MTTVYFIRHAQADATVCDQRTRPLTEKGKKDSALITEFLSDMEIHAVLSSPYKRTIDTVANLVKKRKLTVTAVEDFRGLKVESSWIDNYRNFFEKYWLDFTYRYSYGESLSELRERNISALNRVLEGHRNENIVISTHSVSLAVIINYYDKTFGFEDFISIVDIEPWIAKMVFNDEGCISVERIDLFNLDEMRFPKILPVLCERVKDMMCEDFDAEIRPLTDEHLPQYADVIRRSFATVAKDFGWTRDNAPGHVSFRTDEQLANKATDGYFPFGLFVGENIIGFVSLTNMGNGAYELNKLSVLPEWRHCSCGKRLLDFCKKKVKDFGGSKITLDIIEENTVLKNWYATNGFVHTRTKKFEHLPFTTGYMKWEVESDG